MTESYRIGLTKVRDFLPFANVEFDFSLPGLTVVEGEIIGQQGCDSNGSGKSSLIEAPIWALTGRCVRERYKGDDVIRLGSKQGAMVDVSLVGPKDIRVVRYRKDKKHANKVFLYVDGEDVSQGTSMQTDRRIEDELGMDFVTLMNTVAFGARAEVRSFFFAADADRKKIMDVLLGLGVFSTAHTLAKAKLRDQQRELDEMMTKSMRIGERMQDRRESLLQLRDVTSVDPVQVRDAKILWQQRLRAVERAEAVKLAAAEASIDAANAHQKLVEKWQETRKQLTADRDAIQVKVAEHARLAAGCAKEASLLERQIEDIESLDESTCPTCLQEVSSEHIAGSVAGMKKRVKSIRKMEKENESTASKLRKEAQAIEFPDRPGDEDVQAAREALSSASSDLRLANQRSDEAERVYASLKAQADRSDDAIVGVEKEIADLQTAFDDCKVYESAASDQIARTEFWVQGFSNGGLKSFVIEAELPEINRLATRYARRLLGSGAFVRLQATRALKSKDATREEMVVEANIPGCTESYAGASKGQRQRLDLALILAFRDIVSARSASPFGQLFADELFDGVDATGVDCVVELVQEVAKDCPVLLVTHDARLKSVGDRLVTVRHENGSASLKI